MPIIGILRDYLANNFFAKYQYFSTLAKFSGKLRQSRNSKIENRNLVEQLYSKFQVEILKNVGRDAFLVTAIGQKARTEIWLILRNFSGFSDIKSTFTEIFS